MHACMRACIPHHTIHLPVMMNTTWAAHRAQIRVGFGSQQRKEGRQQAKMASGECKEASQPAGIGRGSVIEEIYIPVVWDEKLS